MHQNLEGLKALNIMLEDIEKYIVECCELLGLKIFLLGSIEINIGECWKGLQNFMFKIMRNIKKDINGFLKNYGF
jgi:hypothetical protein